MLYTYKFLFQEQDLPVFQFIKEKITFLTSGFSFNLIDNSQLFN